MSIAMSAEQFTPQAAPPAIEAVPSPRLRHEGLRDADRNFALAMHLSPLAATVSGLAIFVPLVLWLVRRNDSVFADDHGREVMNFMLSFIILNLICAVTILGLALIPVLWVVAIVNIVRGAIAAGNGEYFRYPMTFRFFA